MPSGPSGHGATSLRRQSADPEQQHERRRRAAPRDTAAAPAVLSLSIWPKMKTEATSVLNGRLPEISTTEPNSPSARAKASAAPARIAGRRFGQDRPGGRSCSGRGAERGGGLLHLPVELDAARAGPSARTNGSVTNSSASSTPPRVKPTFDAERALGPVEREQREPGDDRRQREGQVDQRVDDALARGTRRAPAPRRSACR